MIILSEMATIELERWLEQHADQVGKEMFIVVAITENDRAVLREFVKWFNDDGKRMQILLSLIDKAEDIKDLMKRLE